MMVPAKSTLGAVGVAALALIAAFAPAAADAKSPAKPATKADAPAKEAAKPQLVGTFGDWNVFVGPAGKSKICYALAKPKSREPASLKRDPGYAFISDRPSEGVRNEVSFIMGFDIAPISAAAAATEDPKPDPKAKGKPKPKPEAKPGPAAPTATIDEQSFDLLPKGANLWIKNAALEGKVIGEMKKGVTLTIKASSLKGHLSTDTYSLAGFSQAMDTLAKECPGK